MRRGFGAEGASPDSDSGPRSFAEGGSVMGALALQLKPEEEVIAFSPSVNDGDYVPDGEAVGSLEPVNDGKYARGHGSVARISRRFTPYHLGVAPFARFSSMSTLVRTVLR